MDEPLTVRPDFDRLRRTGDPEAIYGAGKSVAQIVAALRALTTAHPERAILVTRCSDEALTVCKRAFPTASIDEVGRTVVCGPLPSPHGSVAVVAAGTSDLPVAYEAMTTVRAMGSAPFLLADVGIAGLHRLLAQRDRIADADAIIAIAGMEGALPSVVGGLVGVPVIAVPTSVGYGLSMGGVTAMLAMLNSCAPGVVVVNIDNGYGAGVAAARIARAIGSARAGISSDA
jgi:NCAIR mutase (PurE)-related protein